MKKGDQEKEGFADHYMNAKFKVFVVGYVLQKEIMYELRFEI